MQLNTALADCVVREWRADDKRALVRHANDRKVWRNMVDTFPHPYTEADADAWLGKVALQGRHKHRVIEFQGQAVGGIGVEAGTGLSERTGHFGYWLGASHWGMGIATAAAGAFVSHLFATSGLCRLEASVFEWNPASMRVLEKIGFQREGVLRKSVWKAGCLIDSVLYAAIRDPLPWPEAAGA